MNYYERHIGDYLKDTAHLSLLEHGVYTRLMDVYYTREGAIPAGEVARLIGARSKDEREALQAVLGEFFILADGSHSQTRCECEIARFKDKQAKAKRSADARWSKTETHSEGNANASADAMRTHSEGNAPRARPQSPVTSNHSVAELPHGGAAKRGTRLPADWTPGETGVAFASQQGLSGSRVEAELARFRDHWAAKTGADASKADWQATWRNWVRKAVEFGPGRNGASSGDDPFAGAH